MNALAGNKDADYIIIGGGSAGCVLAARLSEDPDLRIVLLEAGSSNQSMLVRMPAGASTLFHKKCAQNWGFETQAQTHLNNRRLYWPRGKGLGGSSAINGLIYVRGHARDYDQWRQMGLEGWGYSDILPYFKRSEHFEDGENDYHGGAGPLKIEWGKAPQPRAGLFDAFVEAGKQAGLPYSPDFNGAQQEGMGRYQLTIWDGERQSAAAAYLAPIAGQRPNLEIKTSIFVTRILVEKSRIVGVEYVTRPNGPREILRVGREVLLCAGAVHSPFLLNLSGIGAPDPLRRSGIEPVHELPGVGQNLQDHLDIVVVDECKQPITAHTVNRGLNKLAIGLDYALRKKGAARENFLESGAFVRSRAGLDRPDLQLHFVCGIVVDHLRTRIHKEGYTVHACQLRPESRGTVLAGSADPFADPKIDPNYLATEEDRRALRESVRITRQILAQSALAPYRKGEILPGDSVQSDRELDAFIAQNAETIYHPVGTCKMGADHDAYAVVDAQLRVHGLQGLRVVDASIMPTLVSGNTNAPTIMIAEKAADMILNRAPLAPMDARVHEPA